MGKIRIHELAKELGVQSHDLIERVKALGIDAKTASSSVDDDVAARLRADVSGGAVAPARKPSPGAKKPAPPPPPRKGEAAELPPARPIERLAKAAKPPKPKMTPEITAGIEERRRVRLARLRGELPTELPPPPPPEPEAPAIEAAPEVEAPVAEIPAEATEPALAVQTASAGAGDGEAAGDDMAAAASGATSVAESIAAEAPAARAPLQLPHLVEAPRPPAPPPAPVATPASEPAAASSPAAAMPGLRLPSLVRAPLPPPPAPPSTQQPPGLPMKSVREFRGPIRKIDLPQQPARGPAGRVPSLPNPMTTPQRTTPAAPGAGQGVTRTFSQKPGTGLGKSKAKRKGREAVPVVAPVAPIKKGDGKILRLTEGVTVKELAEKMDVKAKDIIRILIMRGIMVTMNVALDPELAKSIAVEFGFKPEVVSFEEDLQAQEEEQIIERDDFEGEEEPRPPIVTVMGHVDHGKTSLLDAIRKTNVASGEAGGITQSIGAYQAEVHGRKITFIDTPGHEAFTSMRARGAQVTDVVILVVAAVESVQRQTIEAINHAKSAGVPVIVAINKIDLPGARPDRVRTDLMTHGIVVEQFGGDVVTVDVSARTGVGIEQLLEMIILTADIRSFKASTKRRASGIVLEAGIDRGMGAVASVIVQDGTLRPGDAIILGAEWGRVRALLDDRGQRLESAGPSMPVQVTGIQGVPRAGDRFQVVEDETRAREISEFRAHKRREAELAKSGARGTLQDLSRAIAEGEQKELALVIKADVHGAVEVLTKTLTDVSTPKVKTKIIHSGTGAITDSDVLLASASRAVVIGFNVRPERGAAELAEREKVVVRLHTIIYELVDEMKKLMAGLLDAVKEEEFHGRAEIRQIFKISAIGTVAGAMVLDGKIPRGAEIRLVRDGAIIWTGRLATLKRFKDDAREVVAGFECGMSFEGFNDIKVGDTVEAFAIKEIRPTSLE